MALKHFANQRLIGKANIPHRNGERELQIHIKLIETIYDKIKRYKILKNLTLDESIVKYFRHLHQAYFKCQLEIFSLKTNTENQTFNLLPTAYCLLQWQSTTETSTGSRQLSLRTGLRRQQS